MRQIKIHEKKKSYTNIHPINIYDTNSIIFSTISEEKSK